VWWLTDATAASVNDEQKGWIQRLQHFIRTVWYFEPQIKMFGACFGHQILCKTILELSVKRLALEIGAQPITLSPAFIDAFNSVSTARAPNPLRIQLVHEDHVVAPSNGLLPLDCISVGASANCKIQGIYLPQRLLTFQGHAEFNRDICKSTAEAFFAEKFKWDPSLKVECLRDIDQDDDGWWARKAIWDFLTQQTSSHADIY
jgi:GMP synthase-like glutamine amidotransferase